MTLLLYDCVIIPDGRIGRIRSISEGLVKVRVMRKTSNTHQFVFYKITELKKIACPIGWMSPKGYASYLKKTLTKMKERKK